MTGQLACTEARLSFHTRRATAESPPVGLRHASVASTMRARSPDRHGVAPRKAPSGPRSPPVVFSRVHCAHPRPWATSRSPLYNVPRDSPLSRTPIECLSGSLADRPGATVRLVARSFRVGPANGSTHLAGGHRSAPGLFRTPLPSDPGGILPGGAHRLSTPATTHRASPLHRQRSDRAVTSSGTRCRARLASVGSYFNPVHTLDDCLGAAAKRARGGVGV